MLLKETVGVYYENHKKPINTLCEQNSELINVKHVAHIINSVLLKLQFVFIRVY
jgi:hypothetical protein